MFSIWCLHLDVCAHTWRCGKPRVSPADYNAPIGHCDAVRYSPMKTVPISDDTTCSSKGFDLSSLPPKIYEVLALIYCYVLRILLASLKIGERGWTASPFFSGFSFNLVRFRSQRWDEPPPHPTSSHNGGSKNSGLHLQQQAFETHASKGECQGVMTKRVMSVPLAEVAVSHLVLFSPNLLLFSSSSSVPAVQHLLYS